MAAPLETFQLGPLAVPRLFNGLWQLSSNAWGSAPGSRVRRHMAQYAEHGYTAFGESSARPRARAPRSPRSRPDMVSDALCTRWAAR